MPTPIANVPTDNLYKFLALFGLVITVAGLTFEAQHLNRVVTVAESMMTSEALRDIDFVAFQASAAAIRNAERTTPGQIAEFDSLSAQLRRRISQVSADSITLSLVMLKGTRTGMLYLGVIVVGLILSAVGFRLWYTRLQKYQDIVTRRDAESSPDRG